MFTEFTCITKGYIKLETYNRNSAKFYYINQTVTEEKEETKLIQN